MGKSSPSPPPAPDPAEAARAQGAADLNTAIAQGYLNRTNQTSPFGTSTYNQIGSVTVDGRQVPRFEQVTELSPEQQVLLDKSLNIGGELMDVGQGQLGRVRDSFEVPLDFSNLPQTMTQAHGANPRDAVEDALYQRMTSRLDPQMEQERKRFETQLANQGFSRNSAGYDRAYDQFTRGRNDAYEQARLSAISGAGAEESREQQLRQAERQQAISELLAQRSQPLNELAALMGTSPGVTNPQFQAPPQTAMNSPDVMGAIYGSAGINSQNWRTQQQAAAADRGGMFGLAGTLGAGAMMSPWMGTALGFGSDPDLKTDRAPVDEKKVLEMVKDLPNETWRYKGDDTPRMGPMADEWAKKFGGDGRVIPAPAAFGVSLAAVKALADKVSKLERRVA